MLQLTDFVEVRNVKINTVVVFIRRHPELFDGHVAKKGKYLVLDDVAEEILEKKYPLPAPVEVIEDTESRRKLILALEKITELQEKLTEKQELIARAEANQILLEDRSAELDRAREELTYKNSQVEELLAKNEELRIEFEKEKAKSWWDKLRGR